MGLQDGFLFQGHDGAAEAQQQLFLLPAYLHETACHLHILHHHGIGFPRAASDLPEAFHDLLTDKAAEVVPAVPLHRHHITPHDGCHGLPDGCCVLSLLLAIYIVAQTGTAVGAGNGLGVVAPVQGVRVLPPATLTHGKVIHGR